jgi:biopolymer transport protein ExbB/TolQ
MKRTFLTYLLLAAFPLNTFAAGNDSLYHVLNKTIENQDVYIFKKEKRIENLKHLLSFKDLTPKQQQEKEDDRKDNLQMMLFVISVLLIALMIGSAYIYKQMKRLSAIKNKLHETNNKLNELNKNLSESNRNLEESNVIKEEYIAHFFNLCSTYIDKMETYRKTLNKYASNRQLDDLYKMLRSNKPVEDELEELYNRFDVIFLKLYPTFVKEFNALQISDERVVPKKGELMNTELRIFALIRLGITDSVKIADFLRYSTSTIYNYRVKARNNATVPREEFENYVAEIGTKK